MAVVLLSYFLVQLSLKAIRTRFIYYYTVVCPVVLSLVLLYLQHKVSVVALSSYSSGFHLAINCWLSIVVRYLVPGPMPCPEVVAISYIRPAEVPTLFSVEGDTQVEQKNTIVGFLTQA